MVHLGNLLGGDRKINDVKHIVNDFHRRVNILLAQFNGMQPDITYELFKTYCMSLYGSLLWDYESTGVELFYTAWRKCVRRIWQLPRTTHCVLLYLIYVMNGIEWKQIRSSKLSHPFLPKIWHV